MVRWSEIYAALLELYGPGGALDTTLEGWGMPGVREAVQQPERIARFPGVAITCERISTDGFSSAGVVGMQTAEFTVYLMGTFEHEETAQLEALDFADALLLTLADVRAEGLNARWASGVSVVANDRDPLIRGVAATLAVQRCDNG